MKFVTRNALNCLNADTFVQIIAVIVKRMGIMEVAKRNANGFYYVGILA